MGGRGRLDRIEGLTMALLRPAFPQPFAADAADSSAVICKKQKKKKKHGESGNGKWEMESRVGGIGGRRGLRATARTAGKQHF